MVYVQLVGQVIFGGVVSTIETTKLQLLTSPELSVAVHVTVVLPSENRYGDETVAAGEQLALAIPAPSVGVKVG